MAQILLNILNNALKFTKKGIILVKLENAEGIKRGDEKVCISIRDSGPGIKPEILHSLFTTPLSSGGGTGLGLFICKSIVEAHGGKIWAENNSDGRGSIFHFELPIIVPLKNRTGSIIAKEVNKQQNNTKYKRTIKNILVVDDEPQVCLGFKEALESNGFRVDSFFDPRQALSNFKAGKYDLLLLDVKMPHINGFELYENIKKIDSEVEVCFITANELYFESLSEAFPSIEIGNCIQKPVTMEDLVRYIDDIIELQKDQR
ncbi:MAG: ATP-binding protein [Thermoproteota archaeon]|nr:ATP-binding protein [Thermoproteota archaeon]